MSFNGRDGRIESGSNSDFNWLEEPQSFTIQFNIKNDQF